MIGRILFGLACAMAAGLGHFDVRAESNRPGLAVGENWTVLTMYGDALGAATDPIIDRAIARALANCKVMSGDVLGCGGYFTTVQAGWSLGIRCGDRIIVVADTDLAEAERSASQREAELRTYYVPDMPACARIVTINPSGQSVAPDRTR